MEKTIDIPSFVILAHAGLDKKITENECKAALGVTDQDGVIFIDFDIVNAKLSELYDLPYEQLALEQQRRYKSEVEPILIANPEVQVAYFGLAPIPLAFQLGVLLNSFPRVLYFQFHHTNKKWYSETAPVSGFEFGIIKSEVPTKPEKGKGDVFIRVSTSFRIEPQHTYEVLSNPTNEFDLGLSMPHVDGISSQEQLFQVVNGFQDFLSAYSNFLPDRDKIHLFISSTTAVAFALGTKINPNVYPFVQTYQYSRDEVPKYKEAILISRRTEIITAFSEESKLLASGLRKNWDDELKNIKNFITISLGVYPDWFSRIVQNDPLLIQFISGAWKNLPDLKSTTLATDSIDLTTTTINNGFKYDGVKSMWIIDDGMFINLARRLKKFEQTDVIKAGRLFLFHEGLHYSQDGHSLTEEIATGIGRFPKVIEEADYQADVWAILSEYRFIFEKSAEQVQKNYKQFFLNTIDTAVETMWSFIDNETELTEIQIRSMNRFLNWYWQWIRIERLQGNGELKDIVKILFDKPVIEFAGAEIITLDKQRTCFKLTSKPLNNYELAVFQQNKIARFAPTRIGKIVEGFKEMNGEKIKEGLRSFFVTL